MKTGEEVEAEEEMEIEEAGEEVDGLHPGKVDLIWMTQLMAQV